MTFLHILKGEFSQLRFQEFALSGKTPVSYLRQASEAVIAKGVIVTTRIKADR